MRVNAFGCAFCPWINLRCFLTDHEAFKQRLAVSFIIDDPFLNMFQANPFDPRGRAFKVTGLFPVKLNEGAAIFLDLVVRGDLAQKIGRTDMNATIATNMQVPAPIGGHNAEILDGCFGAVTRAARYGHFELVGHP